MPNQPGPPPQPDPNAPREWDAATAGDIEKKLAAASDLAGELAGQVGATPMNPPLRDRNIPVDGLHAIEKELDSELKDLEHLVGETSKEIGGEQGETTAPAAKSASPSVPDFMAEFLSPQESSAAGSAGAEADRPTASPAAARPAPRPESPSATASAPPSAPPATLRGADEAAAGRSRDDSTLAPDQPFKTGVVGTDPFRPLTDLRKAARTPDPAAKPVAIAGSTQQPGPPVETDQLGRFAFQLCERGVAILERLDRPFSRIGSRIRSFAGLAALATAAVALVVFILSLL